MKHIKDLERKLQQIQLRTDHEGYTGRECPKCKRYFKVVFGTGLPNSTVCICPYCGHRSLHDQFPTSDQTEYIKSVVTKEIEEAFYKGLKGIEAKHKPRGSFGISLSMEVKRGPVPRIHQYCEKTLETLVSCDACTLKYAVYGVFAFCPDCGKHNSIQILERNLALIGKMLTLASEQTGDLAEKLLGNALEDCVSSFDGWGREVMAKFADRSDSPEKAREIRFQNLERASGQVEKHFGFSLKQQIDSDSYSDLKKLFQKRHLLEHKMGVVDEDYIEKSGDASVAIGRKVKVSPDEISRAVQIIRELSDKLMARFEE